MYLSQCVVLCIYSKHRFLEKGAWSLFASTVGPCDEVFCGGERSHPGTIFQHGSRVPSRGL